MNQKMNILKEIEIENFDLRNYKHLIGKGWHLITGFSPFIFKITGVDEDTDLPHMESIQAERKDIAVSFFTYSQGLKTPEIGYNWNCINVDDLIEDNAIIYPKKIADRYKKLLGKYATKLNIWNYNDIKKYFELNHL